MKRPARMLLSFGITALLFLLVQLLCTVTFLNNDDVSIQRALAGWQTGTPYVAHPFLNILFSAPISLLYRLLPSVAWWGRLQQAGLLLALFVIGCCLFLSFGRSGRSLSSAVGSFSLLCLGVYAYALVQIAFTLTAALVGTAAVSLMLTEEPERPLAWPRRIAALLLLFLCFLFRDSSGICLLPFFLLAAVYRTLHPLCDASLLRRARFRGAACVLLAALIASLSIAANAYGRVRFNDAEYEAFDAARSAFADYPHASYEEDPALYASIGWDETLYDLASSWCFLDERVNTETLTAISDASGREARGVLSKLADALKSGVSLARSNGPMLYVLAFAVWIFIRALIRYGRSRAHWPALCCLCFAGGAFLLCGYLCYTGRFLLRTFLLIAYPAITGMLLTLLEMQEAPDRPKAKHVRLEAAVSAALLLPVLAGTALGCRYLIRYDPSARLKRVDAMYDYALAHPETVFIRDMYTIDDIDAFRTFPEQKPVNVIEWGGNGMHTGALTRQVALAGLERLNQDTLLSDRVQVITTAGSAQERFLMRYAENTLHADEIMRMDTLDEGLVVYKFRKDG